jgi:hypothetical protein
MTVHVSIRYIIIIIIIIDDACAVIHAITYIYICIYLCMYYIAYACIRYYIIHKY